MSNLKKNVVNALAFAVRGKIISEEQAKLIVALPLIEIPEVRSEVATTDFTRYCDDKWKSSEVTTTFEHFPFLEAAYWIETMGLFTFNIVEYDKETLSCLVKFRYIPYIVDVVTIKHTMLVKGIVRLDTTSNKDNYYSIIESEFIDDKTRIKRDMTDMITKAFYGTIKSGFTILKLFMDYQNQCDRYPVTVSATKPKLVIGDVTKVDKKLEREFNRSPKVVFLNALPTHNFPEGNATSNEPKHERNMHPCKGFHRTLSHERFKNHPKYLIPKAVYVKPSWRGTKESTYQGNVYRVILPEDMKVPSH